MTRLTMTAAIASMAIALATPYVLMQTAANSDTETPAASAPGNASGPGMMCGQEQGGYAITAVISYR